ncbi:MAG TPA: TonB-dependent receptor [Niabella sp.]|jgi:TonB-linked SusC/RagA family outer membrane protein|nr:TonB-dependent receptor [Chitinophagaceae bacterium]HRN47246.1 TonB-dependent receptor [Niabella sp.]HRO85067.1 TonB-dependent receptor [Niabella sp.]
MRKTLLMVAVLLLFSGIAFSQKNMTGTVTDVGGIPIPNASVAVKGTSIGTSTDNKGQFSLTVPGNYNVLVFSAVGYEDNEILISTSGSLVVTMIAKNTAMDEVVVVGYGTQKRKDLTASIATVKGDKLDKAAIPSVDKLLEGLVTGVQASTPSGILGQAARIRIRGTNSISNSSEPLIVVDGVPYVAGNQGSATPYNPMADINPADIENVEVLKDGAATAIYGSRAANGVILITTKSGKMGKAKISYSNWFGFAKASKKFDLLNANEFVEIANEKFANINNTNKYAVVDPNGVNTDWQSVILRNAFQQNHNLSVSGATNQTNYFISLGYTDMDGIVVANDLKKYNFRGKLEQKTLNNHLTLGTNLAVAYNINNGLNTGTNALSGNVGGAIRAFPNVAPKNTDGSWNLSADNARLGKGPNLREIDDNYTNQAFVLANNIFRSQGMNLTGNAFAKVMIIEGLNVTTQIGVNYLNVEDFWFYSPIHGDGRGSNGIVEQAFSPTFRYNWLNTVDYTKVFNEHSINVVLGHEAQKTRSRFLDGSGTNLSNVFFGVNGNIISNTLANQFYGGGLSERALESYFGRANYSYGDRYLLSATLRKDKISSLPWGKQDAVLPGASIGWRVSRENFFRNISVINDLKIRGGFAKVGNVEIGSFPYAGTFSPVQYGDWSGVKYNRMGNPDLKFETSKKMNIGLDISLLQSRIQLTADYFRNDIDNIILAAPTPPSLGVPGNSIATNIGSMYNKGWEFSLNTVNVNSTDFVWNSTLNVSFVKNEVIRLASNNSDIISAYNITRINNPIGSFFGYEYAGVNPANGNPLWVKGDGTLVQGDFRTSRYYSYDPSNPGDMSKAAAALTFTDKKILGSANPTWFGGFNNNFTYKAFDLNIFLTFAGGNKVYNITGQESLNNQKFMNSGKMQLNRWTASGQKTDVPKLYYGSDNFVNQNGSLNSRFLENADFLRGQIMALGYTLPSKLLSPAHLTSLRVFAQIQNAFILTKYSGLDPELSTSVTTNNTPGLDYNVSPLPRTITVGLNLNF